MKNIINRFAWRGQNNILPAVIAVVLLIMQFVNPSFLAATGDVGALYVVSFASFISCGYLFSQSRYFFLSDGHTWGFAFWLLFFMGSFYAAYSIWSFYLLGVLGVYLLVFFLITNFSRVRHDFIETFIDVFLLFGLLAALLGLYEYFYFHICGVTQTPLIPYLLPADNDPRISGPYGQSNLFALFLSLTLLVSLYRYLHNFVKYRYQPSWIGLLRFVPVLVVATSFFLTRSKGGFLGLFLILCFMLWLIVSKRYLAEDHSARKEFFLILMSLAVAFTFSRLALVVGIEEVVATRSFSDTGTNPSGRFVFWTSAILIFLDHPWLGVGLDNYRFLMNGYGPVAHDLLGFVEFEAMKSTLWAHNEYLQLLAEGGIFLFGLVLFFLFFFFKKIWKYFIRPAHIDRPLFLYSHLFLVPFLIQSQFSWPLRHPALLLLFVT
ncbi:MAG: O-antigen ligase family protein, partial [Bacteroidales bacterium]|nr:O-antigen ligase family protein [Bacteroidales bacterium]